MTDIKAVLKKVTLEVRKRFPGLSQDFKDDLVQEGVAAYLENIDCSENVKLHWIIVRAVSDYYWANISIVKRTRAQVKGSKKSKPKKNAEAECKTHNATVSDENFTEHDLENAIIDMDSKFEEMGRRVAQEYFLVPSAKKILQEREWVIIEARILNVGSKVTRPEIAKSMNVSVERIRQLEKQGLLRLNSFLSSPDSPLKILHPSH